MDEKQLEQLEDTQPLPTAEELLEQPLPEVDEDVGDLPHFDLDDILKEFGDPDAMPEAGAEEGLDEPEAAGPMDGDTIRLDTVCDVRAAAAEPPAEPEAEEPACAEEAPDTPAPEVPPASAAFTGQWEPEYEQPMGEYVPPRPILFQPKNRIRELKRQLVAGPEKRYYTLAEIGVGKLQFAIFLSLLVVLVSAGSTVAFAMGMVPENRLRLMIFGQCLAMLVSALLGSFQLIEGITDLFKKGFTLNTMLLVTFVVCCIDGVFCLQQLRVPCCAGFCLEVTLSLWSVYQRRAGEMGQMDTLRKASRLDCLKLEPDFFEGNKGLLRSEGQVSDFMDHYQQTAAPDRIIGWYSLAASLASAGLGLWAGQTSGMYDGIRVAAVSLLAAVPVTGFIAYSRPFGILVRRLHGAGAVLCGWKAVKKLSRKAVFPMTFEDLFPLGTFRIHGVKFFGSELPEKIIAYGTAIIVSSGSGLAPVFTQVLDSRNGRHYDAQNLRAYDNGGIGGEVCGESVLVGSISFLKEMGVEVPEGIKVKQAICVSIEGELRGLFAVTYDKVRSASMGLKTLCGCGRNLQMVVTAGDCMLDNQFLRSHFGVKTKRIRFPGYTERELLQKVQSSEESPALLLTTREGLLPYAYGIAGARSLRKASAAGVAICLLGGIAGLGVMAVLTLLGRLDLLTPVHMFAYQLLWLIPGLLATAWVRAQ